MASKRSEDTTKGPRLSKSCSFHWTSNVSIIECSHGYGARTKVHVNYIQQTRRVARGISWLPGNSPS